MMKQYRIVFRYLKPYSYLLVLAVCFMAVEVGGNILQPKYMERIIDNGIVEMNMDAVRESGILMFTVAVIGAVGGYISCVFSTLYSQYFGNAIRKAFYGKVIRSPLQSNGISTGSLITRMTNDTRVVSEFSALVLQMLVKPALLFVSGIIMILSLNWYFGLILLVVIPLQAIIMVFFIRRSSRFFKIIQKLIDGLNHFTLYISSSSRLIKAHATEEYESDRFNNKNRELTSQIYMVQRFMAVFTPLITLVFNGVVILVIVIGNLQVQAGTLKIGSVMAAISYSQQILISMMTIGGIFQHIARTSISAERLAEVLGDGERMIDGEERLAACPETLTFEDVSFRYSPHLHSSVPVLQDISFTVRKGETVGILGTTGSGKSTLAKLAVRLYDPVSGRVLINGKDIRSFAIGSVRQKLIVAFQDYDIFSGSLRENIVKGYDVREEAFEKAVETAMVSEFAGTLVNGYDTVLSDHGESLSGGQKQRVSLARALVREPEFLIMDDCTSSLDAKTEGEVFKRIRDNYPRLTKIIISQRISGVRDLDRIILLDNGKIAAQGKHEQLWEESSLYRSIFSHQMVDGGKIHE